MIDDASFSLLDDSFLGGSIETEEGMLFERQFVSLAIVAKASSESQKEEAWVQEMLCGEDDPYFSGNADCSCRATEDVAAPQHDDTTVATVVSASSSDGNSVQVENDPLHSTNSTPTQGSGQKKESSRDSSLQMTREKLDECTRQSARSRRCLIGSCLVLKTPGKQETSVLLHSMVSASLSSSPSLSKKACQNAASGATHKTSPAKKERSVKGGAHVSAARTSEKSMLRMINFSSIGLDDRRFLAPCSSAKEKTTGMVFSSDGGTASRARIKLLPELPTKSRCYQEQGWVKTSTISDFLRIKGNASRVHA